MPTNTFQTVQVPVFKPCTQSPPQHAAISRTRNHLATNHNPTAAQLLPPGLLLLLQKPGRNHPPLLLLMLRLLHNHSCTCAPG
jgi:hypothetical protein